MDRNISTSGICKNAYYLIGESKQGKGTGASDEACVSGAEFELASYFIHTPAPWFLLYSPSHPQKDAIIPEVR